MPNLLFSYENLNRVLLVGRQEIIEDPDTGYVAKLGDGRFTPKGFIALSYMGPLCRTDSSKEGEIMQKYDLKFHVSLPEWDRVAYARGWDVVKDVLIENKIEFSKVAHEGIRMSEGNGQQRGKDVTIYANFHPDKDANFWFMFAQRITEELTRNNIPPGYEVSEMGDRVDKKLNGSNYITYRYERELPPTVEDCCARANIIVENQAHRRPFVDELMSASQHRSTLSR